MQAIVFGLTILILVGCSSRTPTATTFQLYQGPTAVLPTSAPPTAAPPTNTPVMAHPWTPTPIPTATPLPSEVLALVSAIPTADTLEVVMQGDSLNKVYTVRLLGIAVPPVDGASAWGKIAEKTVHDWLLGRVVRLVQDTTVQNADGELPRYVYQGDTPINLELVKMGLADVLFSAPDTRLQAEFTAAANAARKKGIGIWGPDPTATPAITPAANFTVTVTVTVSATTTLTGTPVISPTATGTP